MKKITQNLLPVIIFIVVAAFNNANALPVSISGAIPNSINTITYATLSAAFSAINGSQTGASIIITITSNTTEPVGGAILNANTWTSVRIIPSGGARTVSGMITAGLPLIDLNGADKVTIDGLNSGGNSLTLSNTTVSSTAGTSTIRFQRDATMDTIKRCTVLGSSITTISVSGGNIIFGNLAITTGNDNNVITDCNVGPVGTSLPTKCVYSSGTTTTTTLYNSNNTITNCRIYDYFSATLESAGILIFSGSTDFSITNNKLYQIATRTQTTGSAHSGIQLASSNINNCNITGNTIGFANSTGTGTYAFVGGASSRFYPIYLSTHGTTTASNIQGNIIKNISVSGAISGTGTSTPFGGIIVFSGLAVIGSVTGNTIGSITAAGSISVTSSSASAMDVYGIYYSSVNVANVSNNSIGGINVNNTSTGAVDFYGIRVSTSTNLVNTIQNNTTGYVAAPINNNSATSILSNTYGIYSQAGSPAVTLNTISNLNMIAANTGTGSAASIIGLWVDYPSATSASNVSQNIIRTLSNTHSSAQVSLTGLHVNGNPNVAGIVQRNFIHTLSLSSSSATATMNGINIQGGLTTYKNNMIRLGINSAGSSITNGNNINGISETTSGTDNIYFNSVYIGGTGVIGTGNSYAFQSTITSNTRSYINNIFYNARSNGVGTGKHYSVRVGGIAPNPPGLTMNYNLYLANGTGGVFGFYNNSPVTSLNNWISAVGQNGQSVSSDPQYLTPNGSVSTVNLHINSVVPTIIEGTGQNIVSVTDDYDGQTRAGLTPSDIGADALNATQIPVINIEAYLPGQSCDEDITVEFRNGTNPNTIINTPQIVSLKTNGFAKASLLGITANTNLYVVLKHKNSLETWSQLINITVPVTNYSFKSLVSQAYCSNQRGASGQAAIYRGDFNQDGVIDVDDYNRLNNDFVNSVIGNFVTDLNCDLVVNLTDVLIYYNSSALNYPVIVSNPVTNTLKAYVNRPADPILVHPQYCDVKP